MRVAEEVNTTLQTLTQSQLDSDSDSEEEALKVEMKQNATLEIGRPGANHSLSWHSFILHGVISLACSALETTRRQLYELKKKYDEDEAAR